MPLFDRHHHVAPNHLGYIFSEVEKMNVSRGELERLRCIEREVSALKKEIGPHPLETVLLRGDVLEDVFKLL